MSILTDQIRITAVWRELGGGKLRRFGTSVRGRAFWRDGDAWAVSLDDAKGCWYDHRDSVGGGILDLVVHVRGGDRQAALQWLAVASGIALDDRHFSRAERVAYAREKRLQDRDLPVAQLWRRAAVAMCEQLLAGLKVAIADPAAAERADVETLQNTERFLAGVRYLDGATLVEQYRNFLVVNRNLTSGMVKAAWRRQQLEERALARVLLGEVA